jgi:hypothetical protein
MGLRRNQVGATGFRGRAEMPSGEHESFRIHVKTDQARFVGHCGESAISRRGKEEGMPRKR